MTFYPTIGDGAQALDTALLMKYIQGNAVISGLDVTVNSGTFDQADTITVASGTAIVDGTEHAVSQTDAQIDSATNFPRKDLVYIDGSGNVQVAKGQEATDPEGDGTAVQPEGAVREHTFDPATPDLSGTVGVPVYEIWADPDASSLQSADIYGDRRPPGRFPLAILEAIDADDLNFDPATQSELDTHAGLIDVHHNEDHASRHSEGNADELSVEDLGTDSTASSSFFGPDGSGGVEVRGGGGGTDLSWTHENSFSGTGVAEDTTTLGSTYDLVRVDLYMTNFSNTGFPPGIRLNGDTSSNYSGEAVDSGSHSTFSEDYFYLGPAGSPADETSVLAATLEFPGAFDNSECPINVQMSMDGGVTIFGRYTNTSPINSVTVGHRPGSGTYTADIDYEVFGRNRV